MDPPPPDSKVPAAWQPRFGMRAILLVMVVVSVMGAGGYYLVMSYRIGRPFQLAFILFTLAAPLLVMVAVSVFHAVVSRKPPQR